MKIYSFVTPNLTKILLTAEELGMDYDLHMLDLSKLEHKSPAHIARHPLGKVPAIELNGTYYFESNSICRLLAEKHDNAFYGNSPEQRAIVNQWLDLMAHHAGKFLVLCFFEEVIKPAFLGAPANPDAVTEAREFLKEQLPVVDDQLQQHEYIAGSETSIADFIAISQFATTDLTSIDLTPFPNIENWIQRMRSRAAYQKAMSQFPGNDIYAALKR